MKKRCRYIKIWTILFCCFLLMDCRPKNKYYDSDKIEYYDFNNIGLSNNRVIFLFHYNSEYYKIMFHGKDSIVGFHIEKNNVIDENIPPLMLDFDKNEDEFIIGELNKSPLFYAWNEKEIVSVGVIYQIINFDKNDVQTTLVQVVPTDELTNYLIELIDRYYLPLYVIQENDTLSSICLNIYGHTNYEHIIMYNPELKLPNQYLTVRPNEKIRIKAESSGGRHFSVLE